LFFPREHGATAMLLTPMLCVAILARQWHWSELATLLAATAALSAKDPMIVVARQRFIWRNPHPETAEATRWLAGWIALLLLCGPVLAASWPLSGTIAVALGVLSFSMLAVIVNVRNRQRSTLFQILSAAALTSASLAMSFSATGSIPRWCWMLWGLLALQAATGILVVHARLDARIASRATTPFADKYRLPAQVMVGILLSIAVAALFTRRLWFALALVTAAAGYRYDLQCQSNPEALQLPLKKVGLRALALSSVFAALLIVELW
jgi:hypothetical protein